MLETANEPEEIPYLWQELDMSELNGKARVSFR
jgi:hypothetical protein